MLAQKILFLSLRVRYEVSLSLNGFTVGASAQPCDILQRSISTDFKIMAVCSTLLGFGSRVC